MDNSLLVVSERNLMAITLSMHTKSRTVRGRPTLKLLECFGNGSVRELYERSISERSFTTEPSIEKYQAKPAHVNTTVYLDVIENPVEYQKLLWNVSEEEKETKGICLWAYSSKCIGLTIPKSSLLRRYVKVRRVTKNVCKLHTKRVRLNKVAQDEKKYLLNCSVRIYQRIIKLKYRASRYLSMFSCNKPKCLYKRQTNVSNYCKFQLSSDIEKNPGHTSVYIDLSKTITAPYSQANELVFGQSSGQRCVAISLCPLIYNRKDIVVAVETKDLLFLWLADLNNNSNVCKQISSP